MENIGSIVVIKKFPFDTQEKRIFPIEREKEINECKSEKAKNEKYYVWMLLEESLKEYYGINIKDVDFKKNENGKWTSDLFHFSLSHSGELVALAISINQNIGVDIQERKDVAIAKMIKNKNDYNTDNDVLFSIKEAIYKSQDNGNFVPKDIETRNESFYVFDILSNKTDYTLSVACKEGITLKSGSGISFKAKTIR